MALVAAQTLFQVPTATVSTLLISASPYLRRTALIAPRVLSRGFSTSLRRARYPLYRRPATHLSSKPSPYYTILRHNSTQPSRPDFQPGKWVSAVAGSILLAGGLYIGYSMWRKSEHEKIEKENREIYKVGANLGKLKEQVAESITRGKERVIEAKNKTVEAVTKGKDKTIEAAQKGKEKATEMAKKGKEKTQDMAQKSKEAAQRGKEKASEWMKKKKTNEPPDATKTTPATDAATTRATPTTETVNSPPVETTTKPSQYPRFSATRQKYFDITMVAL